MKLNHKDKKIWLIFTICFAIASIAISAFFMHRKSTARRARPTKLPKHTPLN